MAATEQAYIPGMCNINKAEVAYRKKAMIAGFILAGIVFVASMFLGFNVWIRAAVLFLPLFVGVLNYFQVKNKFCVSYAASGRQNATDGSPAALDIEEAAAKAADNAKARKMNTQSFIISLVIVVISLLAPVL